METFMLRRAMPADSTAGATSSALPTAPREIVGPEFLNTGEAAHFLRLSTKTLEKMRMLGGGPTFRKFGSRVMYAVVDLRAWADRHAYEMTSDPGRVQRSSVR